MSLPEDSEPDVDFWRVPKFQTTARPTTGGCSLMSPRSTRRSPASARWACGRSPRKSDGKNYATKFYNLDVIISVGYRVNSLRGTQFRIWATQRLHEYIVKGFVLDDERLKNPDPPFDYFEELTRRIQDIRTSERRFYQKITDILKLPIALRKSLHQGFSGQL